MDETVIEARGQAAAAPAINIAHAVIGTLLMLTTIVALVVIIIEAVGALARDPDLLTVIDTTDLVADPDMMMMIEFEIEAHAVIAQAVASGPPAQNANHLPPSRLRTNETGGLSLCSNLLLD